MGKLQTLSSTVVLLGQDPLLLETRRWVLERRGYRLVSWVLPNASAKLPMVDSVSLVLLCSSLSGEARGAALAIAELAWPQAPIVVVTKVHETVETAHSVIQVNGLDGPMAMLSAVDRALHGASAVTLPSHTTH